MGSILLSLATAVVVGSLVWLIAGPKFHLSDDAAPNDMLNILCNVAISFVIVFPIVFFLIG